MKTRYTFSWVELVRFISAVMEKPISESYLREVLTDLIDGAVPAVNRDGFLFMRQYNCDYPRVVTFAMECPQDIMKLEFHKYIDNDSMWNVCVRADHTTLVREIPLIAHEVQLPNYTVMDKHRCFPISDLIETIC